jgi:hypothetical protein
MAYLMMIALIVFGGCAVRSVPIEEAIYISKDNEVYGDCLKLNLSDGNPNLIIIRDEGLAGSMNPHVIHIDGIPCADLMPGQKLSLTLPHGDHILGTKNKWDPFTIGRLIETGVTIRDSKVSIVRDGVDANGVHHINLSAR